MNRLRYAERLGITQLAADNEPAEYIEKAFIIWSLDAARAKLNSGSNA